MYATIPDGRTSITPAKARTRTAAVVAHAGRREDAARRAALAVAACAAAVGAWVWLAGARVQSLAFFGVGLTLLWAFGAVAEWRALRRGGPARADGPAEAEAARAHAAAVARHEAALAARPPHLTYGLLACVVVASACQLAAGGRSVDLAGLVKPAARAGEWWRLLTASYLHGGLWHLWANAGALRAFGPVAEAYGPRSRLPLVYLAAALAGGVASLLLLPKPSVGASGGIMGVAAYLLVLAYRRPAEMPPWLRRALWTTLGLTAYLGAFGLAFVDNAAHAGGAAAGALVGLAAVPPAGRVLRGPYAAALAALGWAAAAVLVGGAAAAATRLLGVW